MIQNKNPSILSNWFELVQNDELMQGDIIEDCPVFFPPEDLTWPLDKKQDEIDFIQAYQDVIIMTQSCDLVQGQTDDISQVLLCPIWKLTEAAEVNSFLNSSIGKEECRRGHMTGYHMISGCDHDSWRREVRIVSFRNVWSLPLAFVRELARQKIPRPRLRPPYREHLAQAFARYFMRVGLPVDIPVFRSTASEDKIIKRINAMDPEARKRIISYFT